MEQEQSPWVRSPLLSACLGGASIGGHLLHTLWPLGPAPVENPLCELRKQNKSQVRGQGSEGHEEEVGFFSKWPGTYHSHLIWQPSVSHGIKMLVLPRSTFIAANVIPTDSINSCFQLYAAIY